MNIRSRLNSLVENLLPERIKETVDAASEHLTAENALRVYNGIVAALVLADCYYNGLTLEKGADFSVHMFQTLISSESNIAMIGFAGYANAKRLENIYSFAKDGASSIPDFLNRADIYNHSLNLMACGKFLFSSFSTGKTSPVEKSEPQVEKRSQHGKKA